MGTLVRIRTAPEDVNIFKHPIQLDSLFRLVWPTGHMFILYRWRETEVHASRSIHVGKITNHHESHTRRRSGNRVLDAHRGYYRDDTFTVLAMFA